MEFDDTTTFNENLEAFLDYMEEKDAEMGKILRANAAILRMASDDVSRRRARAEFNVSVRKALDEMAREGEDA